MNDHPMLPRNDVEDDAYCEGVEASMLLDHAIGLQRLEALMMLRRAARTDPGAAYTLGNILGTRPGGPLRTPTIMGLYERAIAMIAERITDVPWNDAPPHETNLRRLSSMAMVNLGILRQYNMGRIEEAYRDYVRAAAMYDGNEMAHLNIGQMNYGATVASPDGELALHHYAKAISYGLLCKSHRPGCECLVDITTALRAVPEGERTAAMPRIRRAFEEGESAIEIPSTEGVDNEVARAIEQAVDLAFADLTQESPIERRVTRVATMMATLSDMLTTGRNGEEDPDGARDVAITIVSALGPAARPRKRQIMPQKSEPETADQTRCRRMYERSETKPLVMAGSTCLRALADLGHQCDFRLVLAHALKTVLASAAHTWRSGLLSTMPNAFAMPRVGPIRIAIPQSIGRSSPVDAMKRWADDPSLIDLN